MRIVLLLCVVVLQGQEVKTRPPDVPQYLMTIGPSSGLSLQWTEYGPSMPEVQKYLYRAYIEGQTDGVPLTVGCEGPEIGAGTFHCGSTPPPLVKSPGIYRVMVTAAYSVSEAESAKSASAPFHVVYPAPQPPYAVVMK